MKRLILLVGNIGSGKSTFARRLAKRGALIVNNDSIIKMLHGDYFYDTKLKYIYQKIEEQMIITALLSERSVVIDRINVDCKSRERWIDLAKSQDAEVIVYDFGSGTSEELKTRLKDPRGKTVQTWVNVFEELHRRYEKPHFEENIDFIYDAPSHFTFYAFDFDGTITKSSEFPKIGEVDEKVVKIINELSRDLNNIIIIWSARADNFEREMIEWLDLHDVYYDFINDNPLFPTGSRKIFAHIYIDDRGYHVNDVDEIVMKNKQKINFYEASSKAGISL